VAPFYALFGAGVTLYFASQGAGKVVWPVLAGTARLAAVLAGGWFAATVLGSLTAVFAAIALGLALLGILTMAAVHRTPWGRA
jgi:hypothetical protein